MYKIRANVYTIVIVVIMVGTDIKETIPLQMDDLMYFEI